MFIHSVYFWLRDDLTTEQRAAFTEGVRSLTTIPNERSGFVGVPASTDRPVIDRSYHVGLVVDLGELAGHDAYQTHPVHLTFLDNFNTFWTKVQIYDFE